ncbi:MAG: hypothetical protein J6M53_06615 [Bacteroidaceae bacterium]|nr:hypothetical protein [Bacteroidaceae bacterium]
MKKTFLFSLLCAICLSAAAQSKKELQTKVTELETENATLTARIGEKDAQIGQLSGQVASLQQQIGRLEGENASLNQRLTEMQGQLAALQAQAARPAPKSLSDSIADFLLLFYRASTVEERAKYVADPARVLPKMRDYYKNGIRTLDEFDWYDGTDGAVCIATSLYALRVELNKNYEVSHFVIRTPDGFKLDWEATTLYGQTTVKQINNKARENDNKTFIFSCGLSTTDIDSWNDYYDYVTGRQEADGSLKSIRIVFERDSAVGRQFLSLIENKNVNNDDLSNQFILKGVYYYNDGFDFIELTEIVSETPSLLIRTRPNKSQSRF